jgi:uncharacterized protein (DUF924 family)
MMFYSDQFADEQLVMCVIFDRFNSELLRGTITVKASEACFLGVARQSMPRGSRPLLD